MNTHLHIKILTDRTDISYIENGEKLHSHIYEYGLKDRDDKIKFLSGVLYMLEMINTVSPIPNKYIIDVEASLEDDNMRHKYHWFGDVLRRYNYTQFWRDDNMAPHVIINSNERYKKRNQLDLTI